MKKGLTILLCVALVACMFTMVSCKEPEVSDGKIHVSSFSELEAAITKAQNSKTIKTIVLDKDIVFDSETYPGTTSNETVKRVHTFNPDGTEISYKVAKAGKAYEPDMTGITLDLNGHSITDIPNIALNFCGNSFTIKNGSLVGTSSTKFALCINYANSNGIDYKATILAVMPSAFNGTDTTGFWAKRIIIDNVDVTYGGLYSSFSVMEIKDSTFNSPKERAMNLNGVAGTIKNVTAYSGMSKQSSLYSSCYSYLTIDGTNEFNGRIGFFNRFCSDIEILATGTVTCKTTGLTSGDLENYAFATGSQAKTEVKGTLILDSTNVTTKPLIVDTGGQLIIDAAASIKDKDGNIIAKGAVLLTAEEASVGDSDSKWDYYGDNAAVTDNRT